MIESIEQFQRTFAFESGARIAWTRVPAFTAATIFWECRQAPESILQAYVREPFSKTFAMRVVGLVRQHWDGKPFHGMRILHGLEARPESDMDSVVLLGLPHVKLMRVVHPSLEPHTIAAFPAYRNEFGGHESTELFEELIHLRTDVGDWNRPDRAQIWMRVDIAPADAPVAPMNTFCLADLDIVAGEVFSLAGADGSLELRNYAARQLSVRGDRNGLWLSSDTAALTRRCPDAEDAMQIIRSFLLA